MQILEELYLGDVRPGDRSGSHGSGFRLDPGRFCSGIARIQANRGCRQSGKYVVEM